MLKKLIAVVSTTFMLFTLPSQAVENNEAQIKASLSKLGLQVESIAPSKMENLYEAFTNQGMFYTSADGKFLIQGKIYEITEDGISSLTEESLAKVRIDGMEKFEGSMIVFPAKDEKYQMTVFTDLTCGYCRKLHNQMGSYNDLGITVRYLAFPRGGLQSQSFTDIRSVWCSDDQQSAMTNAKGGAQVEQKVCSLPVGEQYDFGRKIGVSGTPAIMLDDGMMLPGYKTPEQMKQIFQSYSVKKAG
ncbi:bifunctional protein-disulfide isomerase/oxidoreductase DsbC [Thalassotalea psychrophila]|uniref:Thiol:disulfide interchange protein n=1 Tax=Thalassotalea psychrophila TaxID=3065647 RepID=A0ABY9TUV6_9GAMM|nr:bifunctional protein-disulfide isomerase/oxidoreductase DsbC [Colwelliaceae bacterium SQ149]